MAQDFHIVSGSPLPELLSEIKRSSPFRCVLENLRAKGRAEADDLWGSSAAYLVSALAEEIGGVCLCILPGVEDAEKFAEDISFFAPDRLTYFPAWEKLASDDELDLDTASERLLLIRQLLEPRDVKPGPRIIVAPVVAVLQQSATAADLKEHTLLIRRGEELGPERIAAWLVDQGFESTYQVEVPGEFCRRGGILDVYPYASAAPFRIEFLGDTIESIRAFDPATQASPGEGGMEVCEVISPKAVADEAQRGASILEYLPKGSWVALKEPSEIAARADSPEVEMESHGLRAKELLDACKRLPTLELSAMPGAATAGCSFNIHSVARFTGQLQNALKELNDLVTRSRRTIVLCNNDAEIQRLKELLAGTPLDGKWNEPAFVPPTGTSAGFAIQVGRLNTGFEFPEIGLALVPHHELLNRYQQRRTTAKYRHTTLIESQTDLTPGDYVVHITHGIGLYRGMELAERDGKKEECLRVEYRDKAMLLVPASHIEMLQKYVGPSEHRPDLSKVDGAAWKARKERAAQAAEALAIEMLATQAEREVKKGIAFAEDSEWQREFEAAFIYEETGDQLTVAEEIRQDMAAERPMDRLVCGDVGYGKTELAMRAAFRVVMHGKQVAVLVPTTVLAAQHYRTFSERMADYPVNIQMLSRFKTKLEQKQIIEAMASGYADIIIGTHRLVQEDVRFHDLGLLVIDEEQRFGVAHKERLKKFRATVDVLTLTATPIPRTLHMSLIGLRDISSLNTPPRDRLAIQTRLMRWDHDKIRLAILRELARDGQIFFVHNRVHNIEGLAVAVRDIVPEAKVIIGHGQMSERELEKRMQQFVNGDADVLVCTTIVESGLDIPNANTMLINNAHDFGLADLHQLRGRVGRYKHRAYTYLIIPSERPISPVAQKRLKAIQEFAELGAGFKIAMRDLEIRGAGNILGPEQHGHIAAVGYDMYCRLLEFAIRRRRGMAPADEHAVAVSLGLEAYLPADYMPDARHRIEIYRRLSRAASEEAVGELENELRDRFGPVPPMVRGLLDEANLRIRARRAAIRSLHFSGDALHLHTKEPEKTLQALRCPKDRRVQLDERTIMLRLPMRHGVDPKNIIAYLNSILPRE